MRPEKGTRKKPPARITIAPSMKLTVGRTEAAQMLSISIRGIDYLLASRRLPFRKLGGRVLIPVDELRKYARDDHPERIVA